MILCTFFYIGKIDKAPRKDCCGCTCHTHSKYAGSVVPSDTLPQYHTPGLDNPLGPYGAAGSDPGYAMQVPQGYTDGVGGMGGAHVVVTRAGYEGEKAQYY